MIRDLNAVKLQLELERNLTEEANRTATLLEKLRLENETYWARIHANITDETTNASNISNASSVYNASLNGSNSSSNGTHAPHVQSTRLKVINRRSLAVQGLGKTTVLRGLREEELRRRLESLCGAVTDIRLDALEIAAIVNFKDTSAARRCVAKQMTFPGTNLTFDHTFFVGNGTADGLIPLEFELGVRKAVGLSSTQHKSMMVDGVPKHMGDDELHMLLASKYGNISALHRTRMHPSLAVVEFVHRFPFIDAMEARSLPLERLSDGTWGEMNITGLVTEGVSVEHLPEEEITWTQLEADANANANGDHGKAGDQNHGLDSHYYRPYNDQPYDPYGAGGMDDIYGFGWDKELNRKGEGRDLLSVGRPPRALGGGTANVLTAALFSPYRQHHADKTETGTERRRRSVPDVLVPSPGLEGDVATSPLWQRRRRLSAATFQVYNASAAADKSATDAAGATENANANGNVQVQLSLGEKARLVGERAKGRSAVGGANLPAQGGKTASNDTLGASFDSRRSFGPNTTNTTSNITNVTLSSSSSSSSSAVVIEHELFFLPVTVVGALSGLDEKTIKAIEANRGKHPADKHDHDGDEHLEDVSEEISSSRFQDNSELQYSIRSIERFAPWVRKIYIVTNGQIPSWINLDHPRLQIVPHGDIFLNTSNLPVFSSPAIEANLHRIPGLSKKFIYLNDDVMFGTPIWPEDFYTHAKGQKAYLAWPVPNCVEACPSNWVGDKYCDQACNNIECEWDGGDCTAKNAEADAAGHSSDGRNNFGYGATEKPLETCVVGCSDLWLGDKFCDKACEKAECGMDGGDCGMDALKEHIPSIRAYQGMPLIDPATLVPEGSARPQSIYLNMTDVFGGENDTIAEGLYDSTSAIAAAVVNKVENTLTLVFRPNINRTVVRVTVSTEEGALKDLEDPFEFVNVTVNGSNASNASNATPSVVLQKRFLVITTTAAPYRDPYADIDRVNGTVTLAFSVVVDTRPQPTSTSTSTTPLAGATGFNTTFGDGGGNETGAVRVLDGGRSVNYWEVGGGGGNNASEHDFVEFGVAAAAHVAAAAAAAASTARPKSGELVPPTLDENSLPADVQKSLADLKDELAQGDITQKGYAKYAYHLLTPYVQGGGTSADAGANASSAVDPSADATLAAAAGGAGGGGTEGVGAANSRVRRSLKSLQLPPGVFAQQVVHTHRQPSSLPLMRGLWGNSNRQQDVPSLSPPEHVRNGITITAEEAHHADWIADQKRKQYSYDADMRRAIEEWEERMGQPWLNDTVPSNKISSFPWERLGVFDHLVDNDEESDDESETLFKPTNWHSRLPKDTFGDSLKKVNRLYNKEFGFAARKVIAHMPHMIDKEIMQDLIDMFPAEWAATASHRLRSGHDMQYAFAYFYYLMSVEDPFNTTKYFNELDSDLDGLLSVHELRTLITRLYQLPTTLEDWADFEEILLNCSYLQPPMEALGVGIGPDAREVWVTDSLFGGCDPLMVKFNATVGKNNRYKFELESDEHDIFFKMVGNNASHVAQQLDVVRREPKKFICLNDNIDHRKKSASEVVDALQNFYQSFFPQRSQFELPVGLRNRFLHVDELRAWRKSQQNVVWWSQVAMVIIFLIMCSSMFSKKIKRWRRTWLRLPFRAQTRGSSGGGRPAPRGATPQSPGKLA